MILDEPSSGLDAEAEHEIHSGLRAHRAERTMMLVSHRLNAIRDADNIVVLVDGEVGEQGDHSELVDRDSAYRRLHLRQSDDQPLHRAQPIPPFV